MNTKIEESKYKNDVLNFFNAERDFFNKFEENHIKEINNFRRVMKESLQIKIQECEELILSDLPPRDIRQLEDNIKIYKLILELKNNRIKELS